MIQKNIRSDFITLIPLILSGGARTRLWPLSWGDHPKQFLKLTSDKTMIHETLLRLEGLETRNPIISCGEGHRFMVAQQIGEVSSKKPTILLEQQNLLVLEKQNKSKLFFCVSC